MRSVFLPFFATCIVAVVSLPRLAIDSVHYIPKNVISVPDNCPSGQQLVNGQCREIWLHGIDIEPIGNTLNVLTVPDNCPEGQALVKGQCREILRFAPEKVKVADTVGEVKLSEDISKIAIDDSNKNVISVPDNCPDGQAFVNGQCREIWSISVEKVKVADIVGEVKLSEDISKIAVDDSNKNVISVPDNCPSGQEFVNGQCREIWSISVEKVKVADIVGEVKLSEVISKIAVDDSNKNVISVPDNCPSGQQLINGQCREVWIKLILEVLLKNNSNIVRAENESKNIIQVPNQCPEGYKPDSSGICREVW